MLPVTIASLHCHDAVCVSLHWSSDVHDNFVCIYIYLFVARVEGPQSQCRSPTLITILNRGEALRFSSKSNIL